MGGHRDAAVVRIEGDGIAHPVAGRGGLQGEKGHPAHGEAVEGAEAGIAVEDLGLLYLGPPHTRAQEEGFGGEGQLPLGGFWSGGFTALRLLPCGLLRQRGGQGEALAREGEVAVRQGAGADVLGVQNT